VTWHNSEIDIKLALAQLFLDIAPIAYIEDKLPTEYSLSNILSFYLAYMSKIN
jgi:hypothetical protein